MERNPGLRRSGTVDPGQVAEARVRLDAARRLLEHNLAGVDRPRELDAAAVVLLGQADDRLARVETRGSHLRVVA